MSNFSKNIEQQKERKERNKVRRETLGKFFFDLAKLSFAGLVIGWITPINDNKDFDNNLIVMLLGLLFTIIFSVIGNKVLK